MKKLIKKISILMVLGIFFINSPKVLAKDTISYDEDIVYTDEVPNIGKEVNESKLSLSGTFIERSSSNINYFKTINYGKKYIKFIRENSEYEDLHFKIDSGTKFYIEFVDNDRYDTVSVQEIDIKEFKNIIDNQINYGTKHYFNGYYNNPRMVYHYKKNLSGDEKLLNLYIIYHLNIRESNKLFGDLKKSSESKDLKYTDFFQATNIKKTEVYNDSMGMDYFIDYEDGDAAHFQNESEKMKLYIALKDKSNKYTYYDLGINLGKFDELIKEINKSESYKNIVIKTESSDNEKIDKVTLFVKEL